jgi:hypothetical protein
MGMFIWDNDHSNRSLNFNAIGIMYVADGVQCPWHLMPLPLDNASHRVLQNIPSQVQDPACPVR